MWKWSSIVQVESRGKSSTLLNFLLQLPTHQLSTLSWPCPQEKNQGGRTEKLLIREGNWKQIPSTTFNGEGINHSERPFSYRSSYACYRITGLEWPNLTSFINRVRMEEKNKWWAESRANKIEVYSEMSALHILRTRGHAWHLNSNLNTKPDTCNNKQWHQEI